MFKIKILNAQNSSFLNHLNFYYDFIMYIYYAPLRLFSVLYLYSGYNDVLLHNLPNFTFSDITLLA